MKLSEDKIDEICNEIKDQVSEEMKGGIETIGDYGFKCAKKAFNAALNFRILRNEN